MLNIKNKQKHEFCRQVKITRNTNTERVIIFPRKTQFEKNERKTKTSKLFLNPTIYNLISLLSFLAFALLFIYPFCLGRPVLYPFVSFISYDSGRKTTTLHSEY